MKNQFINLLIVSVFILSFSSCTVTNRQFMPGYHVEWKKDKVLTEKNSVSLTSTDQLSRPNLEFSEKDLIVAKCNEAELPVNISDRILPNEPEMVFFKELTPKITLNDDSCDILILKTGSELQVKIVEINQAIIRYRRCDVPGGPLVTIDKADVFMIKYPNGVKEVFPITESTTNVEPHKNAPDNDSQSVRKTEPLGVLGLITGVFGFFIFGIPFGALSILFGIIGMSKIESRPTVLSGRGFGIVAVILGVIDIIGAMIVISSM